MGRPILLTSLAAAVLASGCQRAPRPGSGTPKCAVARVARLPSLLHETSGLAASRRHPGLLWTHNDSGGEPVLYEVNGLGRLLGGVRVTGARNVDWEDIALGPCASGDCIYIGDIGDDHAARRSVDIYRIPEPAPGDTASAPATRLVLTYPDGPRDAEALYVLPDTSIFIISKGRKSRVAIYRVPAPTSGAPLRLERIQVLSPNGSETGGLVTAADASPDGRWVAIRTNHVLRLYPGGTNGRLAAPLSEVGASLDDARERQGEAVAFGGGDTIWLSSEGGPLRGRPSLALLRCRPPGSPAISPGT